MRMYRMTNEANSVVIWRSASEIPQITLINIKQLKYIDKSPLSPSLERELICLNTAQTSVSGRSCPKERDPADALFLVCVYRERRRICNLHLNVPWGFRRGVIKSRVLTHLLVLEVWSVKSSIVALYSFASYPQVCINWLFFFLRGKHTKVLACSQYRTWQASNYWLGSVCHVHPKIFNSKWWKTLTGMT